MDELYSKDIRVFASLLDLKNNTSKNLIEMLNQLQTGSILNGRVVGATSKGETIFYTVYGRLILSGYQRLSNGDKIVLQLAQNKRVQGAVISINDKAVKNPQLFDLKAVNLVNNRNAANAHSQESSKISLKDYGDIPKTINGQITYLNLSQVAKDSILYKELVQLTEVVTKNISFNVKTNSGDIESGLLVRAEVISNETDGSQLLKTKFGIINVEGSQLPIGKKLNLEIISTNNRKLDINVVKNIFELISGNDKVWTELEKLLQGLVIKDNDEINQFIQEYAKIKELLVPNTVKGEANNPDLPKDVWQTITVPFFHDNDKIKEQELKIQRVSENYLRFLLDINLEAIGAVQLDGLIRFKQNSKIPVNFDIIVRSNQKFDPNFQQELLQAFSEAKLISGLEGYLSFDQFIVN